MAVTAVFQSNQNDRVTLERHREDIFLASRSHRDALFFSCLRFILFFYLISAPALVAWLPGFYREACLQSRTHETIRPLSRGSRLLHITCFSDKSFFFFKLCR